MPLIDDASTDWSAPVTLAADELWQVRAGVAFITTDAAPEADGGWVLYRGRSLRLSAGLDVRYRRGPGETLIARGAV